MSRKRIANWGNYPVVESDERSFSLNAHIEQTLSDGVPCIARGAGRCYGDASLAGRTVSTLRYDKILSFDSDNGVLRCEAGLTLDRILDVIVPKGWFLPVTPGTKFITVGGALASDVHGKNHHVDGAFSAHVQECDVRTGTGEVLTCSPTLRPDLFWATAGGMGLTGIILRVTFSLKKIETAYIKQRQIKAENLDELLRLFDEYKSSTYSVAWIDCLKGGAGFGRSILMLGEHARITDLPGEKKARPLLLPKGRQITFPFNLPSFALNTYTVKAFNAVYYWKNRKKVIDNVVPYEPFFYPLDAILHWNRGYGRKGFVQYQFVLPMESREGLVEILNRIQKAGLGSFLAVLKTFGEQNDLISFPKEGYTLALDFPVRSGLLNFLDELDALVLKWGGRLYLSKDARMKPEMFRAGYPRAEEFLRIVSTYNPKARFASIQSKRLELTQD